MNIGPGLFAALAVMLAGFWLADVLGAAMLAARGLSGASPISGVPVAIVLGLALRNLLPLPANLAPGLKFCTTTLLRLGIVLVGIKLSVVEMARLGVAGVPVVLVAISTGLVFGTWFNRLPGLPPRLGTLIAAGTSICGVTAIVSTAPAIEADEREVAYAVANVVAFGLFGMLVYPYLAHALLPGSAAIGLFLGTAVHDTSQVVGAALTYRQIYADDAVLRVATVTKLGATWGSQVAGERLGPLMGANIPAPATAAQLAASITFLLSDDGTNVNGAVLASDGGWSAL